MCFVVMLVATAMEAVLIVGATWYSSNCSVLVINFTCCILVDYSCHDGHDADILILYICMCFEVGK
jgi:hypothetical protein